MRSLSGTSFEGHVDGARPRRIEQVSFGGVEREGEVWRTQAAGAHWACWVVGNLVCGSLGFTAASERRRIQYAQVLGLVRMLYWPFPEKMILVDSGSLRTL